MLGGVGAGVAGVGCNYLQRLTYGCCLARIDEEALGAVGCFTGQLNRRKYPPATQLDPRATPRNATALTPQL